MKSEVQGTFKNKTQLCVIINNWPRERYEQYYKKYKNKLTSVLLNSEKDYFKNLLFAQQRDTTAIRQTINKILNDPKMPLIDIRP
jgi:site-specific recombinase XerD